jgi:hypothetical protein
MIVEIRSYSPADTIEDFTLNTESDLRDLFELLTSSQSSTVSFGPPPTPSDDADVILGFSDGSYTITTRRDGFRRQSAMGTVTYRANDAAPRRAEGSAVRRTGTASRPSMTRCHRP